MSGVRLACCITELDRGGAELALCEIAIRLKRRGFEPVVYSLRARPKDETASCVSLLEEAGIPVRFLDITGACSLVRGGVRLLREFRKQKPHAALSFLFHANMLARFAAKAAGIKRVYCGIRVAERQARWHLRLDRMSRFLVSRYICVSESVREFTRDFGGIPENKLLVIPNGIDANRYPAKEKYDFQPFESIPGSRKAVFLGRIHRQKGVDWLLDTAATWLRELPEWELLLIGGGTVTRGEDVFVQECYEKRDALGDLSARIHFTGWRAEVPEILTAADLLVLPSRWEGMPNVVLQAMACGRPVLASRVEGIAEVLGPELLEPQSVVFGDAEDFCRKIKRIANDPAFAAELGRSNRARIVEHYDLERMVDRYAEVLGEGLEKE